jgi:hypothetical protein
VEDLRETWRRINKSESQFVPARVAADDFGREAKSAVGAFDRQDTGDGRTYRKARISIFHKHAA